MRLRQTIRRPSTAPLILLLSALLTPTGLGAQQTTTDHTVTVAATGTVREAPDRAVLFLAVESFAATAEEAAAANAERMDALIAALRRAGLDENDIETVSYQIHPEYDYQRGPEPRAPGTDRVVGYRALNRVRVTIDDVDRAGEIIDAAIAAGANRVDSLHFELRDPDAARSEALRQAIARARAEAETIARALGRTLGPALAVSTGGAQPVVPQAFAMDAAVSRAAAPTPIQPGELEITAHVTVVFRLEPSR